MLVDAFESRRICCFSGLPPYSRVGSSDFLAHSRPEYVCFHKGFYMQGSSLHALRVF